MEFAVPVEEQPERRTVKRPMSVTFAPKPLTEITAMAAARDHGVRRDCGNHGVVAENLRYDVRSLRPSALDARGRN